MYRVALAPQGKGLGLPSCQAIVWHLPATRPYIKGQVSTFSTPSRSTMTLSTDALQSRPRGLTNVSIAAQEELAGLVGDLRHIVRKALTDDRQSK